MIQPTDYSHAFEPAPEIGLAEHSIRCIVNEEGRPFDFLAFPHLVACGGPCDAFDADWVRELVLQMASRLGKTFVVLCASLYMAELAPCNQVLAGHVQDLALQQAERVRTMGGYNPRFDDSGLQTSQKKRLEFNGNRIYAAWARSPGTLSNINALFGGASELDLWERVSTSKHPDPEQMFGDRFKDNDPIRKEIYESIPTLQGTYLDDYQQERPRSRIEARRLKGTDCSFWVGCTFCGGRQVLTIDRVTAEGYHCEHCDQSIPDEYRKAFIRSGVWAPAGCGVDSKMATSAATERLSVLSRASELPTDHPDLPQLRSRLQWEGWAACDYLTGTPTQSGSVESFQLSSLYALSVSWKRIADEHSANGETQNFINQWLGETFEVDEADTIDLNLEGRKLSEVITGPLPVDQMPEWVDGIALSIDRQRRVFPWMVTGWSEDLDRVHIPNAANVLSFEELEALCQRWSPGVVIMDSGYMQKDTLDWCLMMREKGWNAYPCKGAKAAVVQQHYKCYPIEDEMKLAGSYGTMKRVDVNTQSTQEWASELLEARNAIRIWDADQFEFCKQLLNDQETIKQVTSTWDRIESGFPNDQRDNLRYGFVGAQLLKAESAIETFEIPKGARLAR